MYFLVISLSRITAKKNLNTPKFAKKYTRIIPAAIKFLFYFINYIY